MIRYLAIRNLAVIESVAVEFEPAFNILTGETGAGKSILVEAVGLLLGGRASQDLIRIIAAGLRGAGETVCDDDVAAMAVAGGAPGYARIAAELIAATFGADDAS